MADDERCNQPVINVSMWDKAEWRGVLYIVDLSFQRPPILGLMFRREEAAEDIFTSWRSLVGREDEHERIRISVVEGDIPGQDYGYTVHITADPDYAFQSSDQSTAGSGGSRVISVSRVFRMNPDPGSKNLPNFKNAFERVGKFLLIPVIASTPTITSSSIKPRLELGVSKSKIFFRNAKDIGKGDIDSVVFVEGL
jgi:hypothetical protein